VTVVEAARGAPGCLDFSITADSSDAARVRVYESWEEEAQLLAFRSSGPSESQQTAIVEADVKRYLVTSVGEPWAARRPAVVPSRPRCPTGDTEVWRASQAFGKAG
jgi:hypothetical protein